MTRLVIISHANSAFGLALQQRLSADGRACLVVSSVAELSATGRRDDKCIFLFDMLDDEAWQFVDANIDDLLPHADILPVNGSKFAAGDEKKIDTYCKMVALVERLSAISADTMRL